MMQFKFSGIIASAAVILVFSQSSYSFQKSPSEIAKEITVLIDGCGLGSGVIFKQDKNTYLVLTARHVLIQDVDCLVITSDRERYTAKKNKVTYYQGLDLVVMEFESNQSYPVGKLGKSEEATIGNTVYVAGASRSNENITKRDILVSKGEIISTTFELELGYTLVYNNTTKKGMSGGPVVDEKGEVIGITGRGNSADGSQESYGIPIQKFLTGKIGQNLEDYYLLQGKAFIDEENYEEAITAYNKVIEINPNDAYAYYNRGVARYELGDKESAIADYNQAIEINPNYANAYNNRGVARSELGDKESAIADYNQAIEINPNYANAYYNRGLARYELGDKESAITDLNKAIEINPNYANAYGNRGVARYELGDKEGAIADLNKAIEINPNYANAYYNRGVARDELGDKESAIEDYNQAIEINPNDANAYNNRGNARYELGDKEGAIADYNQAIEINPNDAKAYYNRGNARASLGDTKDAIVDFEKAAELLKKDGNEYWYQNALKRIKELRRE